MNLLGVLQGAVAQGVIWGVMVLGAYITFRVLDFADLSVDGTFALGGVVSMVLTVRSGLPPALSLIIAIFAGMLGGLATALMATKLKIPELLSGILTMLSLYSINMMITGGVSNVPKPMTVNSLIEQIQMVLPLERNVVSILLGLAISLALVGLMYWFFGTEIGCALRASGNNPHMARALGTNTDAMIILGLMLSNGLVALSGGLWAQYQDFADVGMGTGTMVTGLASIMIGQVVFRFMRRSFAAKLFTAVLGSVSYWLIVSIVIQLGLGANNLKLFTALLVLIALSIPTIREKVEGRRIGQAQGEKAMQEGEGK